MIRYEIKQQKLHTQICKNIVIYIYIYSVACYMFSPSIVAIFKAELFWQYITQNDKALYKYLKLF